MTLSQSWWKCIETRKQKWRNVERISHQPLGQVSASLWLASLLRAVIMPPAGGQEWRTPSACMCGRLCVLSFIRRDSAEVHLSFLRAGVWLKERLCTRTKFTQTDGEQLLGSTSGKLTARAVSLLQLYYINLDYCRCKSCCQSLWTEWLNVSLLHRTLCTGWGDIPGSLGVLGDLVIYIIVRRLSFYIDSQCALLNL